jgi:hypothetical protein
MKQRSTIGRRGARRLLESAEPAGPHERRVAEVLAALAPGPETHPVPEAVLAAFAEAGEAAEERPGRRARRRARARAGRVWGAAVKTTAVVLVLSGGTIAAAAADVLPAPAQRMVHNLFGSWGVPAPHPQPGTGGPSSSPSSAPASRSAQSPTPSPSPSAPSAPAQTGTGRAEPAPSTGRGCPAGNTRAADSRCVATPAQSQVAVHPPSGGAAGHTPTQRANSSH